MRRDAKGVGGSIQAGAATRLIFAAARSAAVLAVLDLSAGAAFARSSTLGMTCRQAQNLVALHGAVVMSTGRHTYERFVASPGYCMTAEWAYSAIAPTKDTRSCPLGYVCNSAPPLEFDRRGDHWFFDR